MKAVLILTVLCSLLLALFYATSCNKSYHDEGAVNRAATSAEVDKEAPAVKEEVQELFGGKERKLDEAFHYATGGQPKSCDPHKMASVIEWGIVLNTFEGLGTWTFNGPSDGTKPGMAESWTVSEDGKTYTFKIFADAKWSDGTPLTAQDFAWSWTRARSKEVASLYAFLYDESFVESFEATDDRTFVVRLSKPNRIFLSAIVLPVTFPVPRHVVEKHGDAWCRAENFVGNGPYRVTQEVLGDSITLEANPQYYKSPDVKKLVAHTPNEFKLMVDLYKSGKLDWIGMQVGIAADELESLFDKTTDNGFNKHDLSRHPLIDVSYISLNTTRGPLGDARVRSALSLSLNRADLVDNILRDGSTPTNNFIPMGLGSYDPYPTKTDQNCEQAKALLAEAGFKDGANFPKLEFIHRTGGREPEVATAIADQWKQCLGIEMEIVGIDMKLWMGKVTEEKNYDISMDRWLGDYPHPQTFAALVQSANHMNHGAFKNADYDQAIADGMTATDDAKLQEAYRRAEQVIDRETPVIPLFNSPRIHALRPEWTGIADNPAQYHPLRFVHKNSAN